jgi:hypothetical protein
VISEALVDGDLTLLLFAKHIRMLGYLPAYILIIADGNHSVAPILQCAPHRLIPPCLIWLRMH